MKINFVTRKSQIDKNGLSHVFMSICIGGSRKYISTGKKTDAKKKMAQELSEYLDVLAQKYQTIETEMLRRGIAMTMANFMKAYEKGFATHTIKSVFDECIELKKQKMRARLITEVQYLKYERTRNHFLAFKGDIDITDVTPNVVDAFAVYLRTKMQNNSAINYLKILKSVLVYALNERYIDTNPYRLKLVKDKTKVEALSDAELKRIEEKEFDIPRLALVRDCFLIQCYTALSYADIASFTKDDIKDGMIIKPRGKTKVLAYIPLLDGAKRLLEKYDYKPPIYTNQKYNSYLKEIQDLCHIKTDLHSHVARHTCATMLLNKGVSMEIVAKVLGHSSSRITGAVYAKMRPETVKEEVLSKMS